MITISKKPTATTAATPTQRTVVKNTLAAGSTSKVAAKKAPATPVKKTATVTAKTATPAIKTPLAKTAKPTSRAKVTIKKTIKKSVISAEDRYHMIAIAAYFRAEKRGFAGGYEMEDWIASEAQIDTMLNA